MDDEPVKVVDGTVAENVIDAAAAQAEVAVAAGAAPADQAARMDGGSDQDSDDERRRRRAEKFGTDFVPKPAGATLGLLSGPLGQRRAPARSAAPGKPTNTVDIFTEEEQEKARKRAERFGIEAPNLISYEPVKPREDEELRKKRAERFGIEYEEPDLTGLKKEDLLETRKDVEPEVQRRADAVHVYGVDVLSTRDIREHFKDFHPHFVEWINDSSCNVLFEDSITAKRAVVTMGKPLPPEEAPDSYGIDLTKVAFLWHRGIDTVRKDGKDVPLLFRIATVKDVKDMSKNQGTRELWKKPDKRKRGGGGDLMETDEPEGGARGRRRNRRKRLNTGEAMDVDEDGGDEQGGEKKSLEGVTDLRELLSRRRNERGGGAGEEGSGGAAAGGGKGRRPRGRGSVRGRSEQMMDED